MDALKRWYKKIFCSKPKTTLIEVRRGRRYVLLMEVPSDLNSSERTVLQNAVNNLKETMNHWLTETDEPFMTVLTISGMPIIVKEVSGDAN